MAPGLRTRPAGSAQPARWVPRSRGGWYGASSVSLLVAPRCVGRVGGRICGRVGVRAGWVSLGLLVVLVRGLRARGRSAQPPGLPPGGTRGLRVRFVDGGARLASTGVAVAGRFRCALRCGPGALSGPRAGGAGVLSPAPLPPAAWLACRFSGRVDCVRLCRGRVPAPRCALPGSAEVPGWLGAEATSGCWGLIRADRAGLITGASLSNPFVQVSGTGLC